MGKELVDVALLVGGQSDQDVFEVGVGIVAVELGRLDQARNRSGTLARAQAAGEQPVRSSQGPGPDLRFVVVVINGQRWVVEVAHQP